MKWARWRGRNTHDSKHAESCRMRATRPGGTKYAYPFDCCKRAGR
ncbi:MAG: hypothetical protein OCU12_08120 [Methanophagales archaeon]|nr:hypothetical protein [Methanophagales archaeon]